MGVHKLPLFSHQMGEGEGRKATVRMAAPSVCGKGTDASLDLKNLEGGYGSCLSVLGWKWSVEVLQCPAF